MTAVRTISPAPRNAWLPDGGRGEVMKPCCARCRRGIKGFGELPCGYPDGCPNAKCGHSREPVHWVGDAPTSLHGNGAISFARTTRESAEVTCVLCRTLLARAEPTTPSPETKETT